MINKNNKINNVNNSNSGLEFLDLITIVAYVMQVESKHNSVINNKELNDKLDIVEIKLNQILNKLK